MNKTTGGVTMNRKMLSALAGAALLCGMGAAYAQGDPPTINPIDIDTLITNVSNLNLENLTDREMEVLLKALENREVAEAIIGMTPQ
jgi:hypothetical protein